MGTEFAVKVVTITDVLPHPNADRLELAQIAGWQCVIQKGAYKKGDLAVYVPIDSILPDAVERKLFGSDSKIKLTKSRVKTIKIRGAISQGMLAPCDELGVPAKEGYDCTKMLGVTKFEPKDTPVHLGGGQQVKKLKKNPLFKEYGGLDNFKHYPDLFEEGEEVIITEKIHGTNFRFGWLPTAADTPLKRLKKFFGLLPKYEFVFGSNRVQLHNRVKKENGFFARLGLKKYKGFYEDKGVGNVYEEAVEKYNLKERTSHLSYRGLIFYGEIYGDSIQANYTYGCKQGERKFVGFDILNVGVDYLPSGYLNFWLAAEIFGHLGLDTAPILYEGPHNAKMAKQLTLGNSVLAPSQKIREGVVIRPVKETTCHMGRKVLKLISDEYLLKDDNTDFH